MFHYFNRQSEHLFRHNDSALQFSIICHFVSIYLLWLLKWPKPNRSRSHNENSYTRMWIECLHWHWDNERNFTSSLCTFQQSVFWLVAEISLADKRAHHSKASKSIDFAIWIKRCVCMPFESSCVSHCCVRCENETSFTYNMISVRDQFDFVCRWN